MLGNGGRDKLSDALVKILMHLSERDLINADQGSTSMVA